MSHHRILVVEDNAKNLKLVKDVLTLWGYDVIEASTGEDGVRLAEEAGLVLYGFTSPQRCVRYT